MKIDDTKLSIMAGQAANLLIQADPTFAIKMMAHEDEAKNAVAEMVIALIDGYVAAETRINGHPVYKCLRK